jgi:hypothetical protein
LLWLLAAMLAGPVAISALESIAQLFVTVRAARAVVPEIILAFMMMVFVTGTFATVLGLAYLPLLLAWGRWGRRFGRWERARGSLCLALAGLAAPAALAALVINARLEAPFGARGGELAGIVGFVFLGTWLGLALPRLVLPALRPGVFADGPSAT